MRDFFLVHRYHRGQDQQDRALSLSISPPLCDVICLFGVTL